MVDTDGGVGDGSSTSDAVSSADADGISDDDSVCSDGDSGILNIAIVSSDDTAEIFSDQVVCSDDTAVSDDVAFFSDDAAVCSSEGGGLFMPAFIKLRLELGLGEAEPESTWGWLTECQGMPGCFRSKCLLRFCVFEHWSPHSPQYI